MKNYFLGLLIALIYTISVLPKKHNRIPNINFTLYPMVYKGMIYIPIDNEHAIHVHHWLINLIILIIGLMFKIQKTKIGKIVIGIMVGLFLQGISYKDSLKFKTSNPFTPLNKTKNK